MKPINLFLKISLFFTVLLIYSPRPGYSDDNTVVVDGSVYTYEAMGGPWDLFAMRDFSGTLFHRPILSVPGLKG